MGPSSAPKACLTSLPPRTGGNTLLPPRSYKKLPAAGGGDLVAVPVSIGNASADLIASDYPQLSRDRQSGGHMSCLPITATNTSSNEHLLASMSSSQLKHIDKAQLQQRAIRLAREEREGHTPSLLTWIGFGFLTFNSGMAVYRSNGDMAAISFVGFSYLDLVLLFYCLRLYERTPPESPRREHLKMAVWLLTTMLTAAFSYKVAAIMPFPVQVLVWAMACVTVLGGFYAFFLYRDGSKE
ncbi:hypothetical protein EJB05_24861, partial [Eragrostis curvula]